MKTLLAVFLFASVVHAETFHITGVKRATEAEKTYRTSFSQNLVTGTIGNKQYTLEQLASWGYFHFEVGAEYPVVKVTDKSLKLRVTDKKGRESTESLNIVEVKEGESPLGLGAL
jgi:hypothetical protein